MKLTGATFAQLYPGARTYDATGPTRELRAYINEVIRLSERGAVAHDSAIFEVFEVDCSAEPDVLSDAAWQVPAWIAEYSKPKSF